MKKLLFTFLTLICNSALVLNINALVEEVNLNNEQPEQTFLSLDVDQLAQDLNEELTRQAEPSNSSANNENQTSKKHLCDICSKAFIAPSNLAIHKRIHTGERPYKCDVCDKTFTQLSILKTHKYIHTREKPFICNHDDCSKAFTTSSSLIRHKRIHTGEKPHICDHEGCNKAFTQLCGLKKHKKTHSKDQPY